MAAPINFIDAKVSVPVTASITLDITHKGKLLVNDTTSNFVLTVPNDATVNYGIGSELAFQESNTGRLQLAVTAGVTVKDIDGSIITAPTTPPVTGLVYSQSSDLVGVPATVIGMTDGLLNVAVWTQTGGSEWIEASFNSVLVSGATIGSAVGDYLPVGYGPFSVYQNQCKFQYWNGSSWIDLVNISGMTASGELKTFSWTPVTTTKLRITGPNFVGTTEFQVLRVSDVFHEVADRCLIRKTAANTWILETTDLVEQSTIATFNPVVDFDSPLKVYASRTVAAVEAFTVGTLGKVPGARVLYRLVADGVNVPTFTGFKRQGNQDYLNVAGAITTIEFIYDGIDSLYRVSHDNPFTGTPFKISVKTDNVGTSTTTQFTIPPNTSYTYDFYVAWGDGTFDRVIGATIPTHTYPAVGTYTISIWGNFPAIQFNNGGDRLKLLSIVQWGSSIEWLSMQSAFFGCTNLSITTTAADAAQARTGKVQNWNRSFALTGLTTFPIIDTSGGIDFTFAWNTTAIAAFPLLVFSNGQIFTNAFSQNTAMVTFAPRNFPAAITLSQGWTGNSLLSTFNGLNAPIVTNLVNSWFNCPALNSWSSGPLPNCQSFQNAWNLDAALTTWSCGATPALTNVSGALGGTSITTIAANNYDNVSNFALAFSSMTLLTSFLIRGIRVSFSLANCALSATAIDTVFSNLAVLPVAGSQTITVTGNPGAATCTQSIATNKGWVVVI